MEPTRTSFDLASGELVAVPLTAEEIAMLEEAAANQPVYTYTLQMSDFWSRFADDAEYEAFDEAASIAPLAKDRRAFGVAVFLVSNSPLFNWTKNVLTGAVGADRAEAIMADSSLSAARPAEDAA